MGGGAVVVGFLSGGTAFGSLVFVGGMVVLDLGLVAGAGSQAIERRARGVEPYLGPSPFLVVLVAVITVYLLAVVVGLPLSAAGVSVARPVAELVLVALSAAGYAGITRLLVVGTEALSWAEIGLAGPGRRAGAELAWGAALAGPVVLVTAVLSAAMVSALGVTPPSPLPPTGTAWGLALNLLGGAVLAPIGEEILFRGVATTAWVRGMGERGGIVRAALLFALLHVLFVGGDTFNQAAGAAIVGFVGRLPVALVLGWAYIRRGSLWAPIGLHAAFNAVLLVLAELAVAPNG